MRDSGLILFLPYAYGFNTRAKTIIHRISFLLYIIAPCLMNIIFMRSFDVDYGLFVLAFSGMYIVYEIGYIYNDVYTTKRENNPTRWIKTDELERYVEEKYPLLISSRIIYLTSICVSMSLVWNCNIRVYIICLALLYLFFSLHNYFRGFVNVFTDGLLNLFKYLTPLIAFAATYSDVRFFVYLLFEVPVARMIGYVIGKNYAFHGLAGINVDVRRVLYYFILTTVAGIMCIVNYSHIWFLYGVIYMLIYRIFCLILSKREGIRNTRWKNGDRNANK